jgi:hypothetical protein
MFIRSLSVMAVGFIHFQPVKHADCIYETEQIAGCLESSY